MSYIVVLRLYGSSLKHPYYLNRTPYMMYGFQNKSLTTVRNHHITWVNPHVNRTRSHRLTR